MNDVTNVNLIDVVNDDYLFRFSLCLPRLELGKFYDELDSEFYYKFNLSMPIQAVFYTDTKDYISFRFVFLGFGLSMFLGVNNY